MYSILSQNVIKFASIACYGTSFDPEKRSSQLQARYVSWAQNLKKCLENANVPEGEINQFLQSFTRRYNDWLYAKSRCISSTITGPSNFPIRKAEKANDSEHKKYEALSDFAERVCKKLCNRYSPNPNIIRSDDSEAIDKLKTKIAKEEARRDKMKTTNAAWRKYAKNNNPLSLHAIGMSEDEVARMWEKQPFSKWQISNLGANIRRLKDRLVGLERVNAMPKQDEENGDVRMVVNTEIHRIQLFFPKDRIDIRSFVNSHGFHFAPSQGNAWQRHLSERAKQIGQEALAMGKK